MPIVSHPARSFEARDRFVMTAGHARSWRAALALLQAALVFLTVLGICQVVALLGELVAH
jgi:hypothetical protein